MSLSTLADIADLIAAAAIILSLGFVGYELHLTRKQSELSNWREVLQAFVDYKAITNDLEFSEFLVRAHKDYAALSESEKQSFGLYLEQGIHVIGNFIKHNDSLPKKLVGLEDAVMNSFYEMLTTPGGAAWWEESHNRGRFMPETYKIVDALIEQKRGSES